MRFTYSGRIGEDARPALPDLNKLLSSSNRELRICAAMSIAELNPDEEAVVPVLIDALSPRRCHGERCSLER